ncbi:microsomal signal peptidase 25 kDa subunit [Striga asiatica]|uniref:Microsomal signal peptidase 25 kDa subunit n=1 Tax=Striga asiatica TaxID=4170 RepID=A0A5A7QTT7_STRAF|nr:microsomal signal peptidase 25 kDa subunit [Striga asiatica]
MQFLSDAAEGCWIDAALPLTIPAGSCGLVAGSCGQWWCREGRVSVDGSGLWRLRRIWLWRSELGTLPLQLGILNCDRLRLLGWPLKDGDHGTYLESRDLKYSSKSTDVSRWDIE